MGLFTCHMKVIIQRKQWLQFGSPTVRNFKRKLSSMNSVLPLKAEDGRSDLQEKPTTHGGIENVPFMVPVHVIKKAYIVNSNSTVPDVAKKYAWLTKTFLNSYLPSEITSGLGSASADSEDHSEKSVHPNSFLKAFKKSLHQISAFQRLSPSEWKLYQDEATALGLANDLIKIALANRMSNKSEEHLSDLFLDHLPMKVVTHWMRDFNFFEISFTPTFVLRSSKPPYFPVLDSGITDSSEMPRPYGPYTIGVYQHGIIKLKNFPGFHNSEYCTKPHVHTIVQVNCRGKGESQINAQGIITMFSQLLSLALDKGHHLGTVLPEPLISQCIITNGFEATFMVYQLNTLDLQTDRGVWNVAWSSGVVPLYEIKDDSIRGRRSVFETSNIDSLQTLNSSAVELFLQFLRRPIVK